MLFRLTNIPTIFQQIINNILRKYLDIFIIYYLNDILIFLDNKEEHTEHIHKVLQTLQDAKLLVEPDKCFFYVTEVDFLGYTITLNEIQIQKSKITIVTD